MGGYTIGRLSKIPTHMLLKQLAHFTFNLAANEENTVESNIVQFIKKQISNISIKHPRYLMSSKRFFAKSCSVPRL